MKRTYSSRDVVTRLRSLANAFEQERTFRIQVAGERIRVIEFQLMWSLEHIAGDLDRDPDESLV